MAYRVIKAFSDGQDNMHVYNVGDEYPRKGANPTKERIAGLLGMENKQKTPLIETVAENTTVHEVEEPAPRKARRKKG